MNGNKMKVKMIRMKRTMKVKYVSYLRKMRIYLVMSMKYPLQMSYLNIMKIYAEVRIYHDIWRTMSEYSNVDLVNALIIGNVPYEFPTFYFYAVKFDSSWKVL